MIQIKVQKKKEGKTKYSFTSCLLWVGTGVREPRILGAGLEKIHTPLPLPPHIFWKFWGREGGGGGRRLQNGKWGVLLRVFGEVVQFGFPNPDPIQTKICNILVLFSHLASKILTHFQTCFLKTIPIFRLTGQNGSKTVPFDTACTYTAYIGE